jgi:hypothetical protein
VNVDQQLAAQTSDANSRHQVVDRRGSENRKPDRRKAGGRFDGNLTKRAINLDRFEKTESMLGKGGKLVETIRCRGFQSCAELASEIRRSWQPVHHILATSAISGQGTSVGHALSAPEAIAGLLVQ